MRSARVLALALTLAAGAAPPAASAAAPAVEAEAPRPLHEDLRVDAGVLGASGAVWLGTELLQDTLAPVQCRFCGTNALDAWARRQLLLADDRPPRVASDVLTIAIIPAGVIVHQLLAARAAGDAGAGAHDLLYVAEATGVALALDQVVKLAVGRQRPFVHYRNYADPARPHDSDDNLSFYSGHTTIAFSMAAAAGTVSTLRGYRSAPWVWAVGMTLATAVGWARIASDRHYLTDVLASAATGAGIGVGLPLWLHGRADAPGPGTGRGAGTTVVPLPLGVLVLF
jgi:membrane-associated phospholipid phosphatase